MGVLPSPLPSGEVEISEAQAALPASSFALVGGVIVESLTAAQASQTALLRTACATAITGGFTSNALGSTYTYGSSVTDQANLNTVASNPNGGSLWCEAGGVWALKAHT